jgi:hypothetical protein
MSKNGWIGVDLDGTLAEYDGWKGPTHIGRPVTKMLNRVQRWLTEGREVRIFTARVSHDGTAERMIQAQEAMYAIRDWVMQHVGRELAVTCVKDYGMVELWDDRCVQVMPNTGLQMGVSTRGLDTPSDDPITEPSR